MNTRAEKLERAKRFLKGVGEFSDLQRNLYVLDRGTSRPRWGIAGEIPVAPNHSFMQRVIDADHRGSQQTFFGRIGTMIKELA